jgi:hypothetical protein
MKITQRIGQSKILSNEKLTKYAEMLGFKINNDDCEDIRKTSFTGETISSAVRDYLNANECPVPWKGFRRIELETQQTKETNQ